MPVASSLTRGTPRLPSGTPRSEAQPEPFRVALPEAFAVAGLVLVARAQFAAIARIGLFELPLAFEIPHRSLVAVFAARLTPVVEAAVASSLERSRQHRRCVL